MKAIRNEEEFRRQVSGTKPTIAVFKTTWCPDCHYIDPFMPDVEKSFSDRFDFIVLDRDDLPDLCSELNILGIPSFIAFKEGKELTRFVSKLRKTRDEIEQFLERSAQVAEAMG